MKTNNDMKHGGKLKTEYRQAWADYFVKYIKAYAAEGLRSVGSHRAERGDGDAGVESCIFTAAEEKDFVRDHSGPPCTGTGSRT